MDRLGDAKVQVRDQAAETILKLMVPASHPQVGEADHQVVSITGIDIK